MAASSSKCHSLGELLETWGVGSLASAFEKADINLSNIHLLDETTARSVLSPGSFLNFWGIFLERKVEILVKRRKIDSNDIGITTPTADIDIATPAADIGITTPTADIDIATPAAVDTSDDSGHEAEEVESSAQLIQDLKDLFNSSFVGQTLMLTAYEDRTDTERNKISEIIITYELGKSKSDGYISRARFIALSETISKVFDGEDKFTFYIPYRKVNNNIFIAKGKLVNQYYYWRQKGINAGLLNSLRSKNTTASFQIHVSDDVDKSVKWLSVNLGPENLVLQHWRATYSYRMSLLDIQRKNKISIPEYFSKFPVLRQPVAVKLLVQEYDSLYQGTADNLELNFVPFAKKLLLKLGKVKGFSKCLLDNLQEFLDIELGVAACHHFFACFSHLFPPQVVVRGRKPNNWTATKNEMQQGFLLHVASEALLETAIQNRINRLSKFKKPLPFSPFPVIVGKDLKTIEKCIVVIQPNDRFIVSSPKEAIDVTFKAIHSLCVEYPVESKSMWLLLQQAVYKVYTQWDEIAPALIPTMKFFL